MSRRHATEHGFTLVELLVAMVLGAIVLAMIVGVIMDMFGSSQRSAMRAKSQRATVNAAEMLTSDLRAMRAPQREPLYTGSADNLRNLLLFERNPGNLLVHDLVAATRTQVVFFAEVDNASANVECVTWAVQANGSLRRTVRAFSPTCAAGATSLHDTEVMPAPERARATAAAAVPDPFSYRMLVHPADTTTVRPNACTATTRTSVGTTLGRDQVMAVEMDLRSFVAGKVGRGDQELVTAASIASRQAQEYRFAIGCVA